MNAHWPTTHEEADRKEVMMRPHPPVWSRHTLHPRTTAALAWLTIGLAALAQTEQWLEYHTGMEPMGYRWLELSTNPPPSIPFPALQPGAWYGRWTNAVDTSGGRWFCLDRTRRFGLCDRLVFDTNGNDRLDDDAPVGVERQGDSIIWFEPIKLVFKGEDGPVSYHLATRFYQFDQQPARLLAGSGGWYEGNVRLAGKKLRVRLIDNTVNGVFNDVGESPNMSDQLFFVAEESYTRYLGRYLEVDGQLLRLEVARDGAFLKAKPADGVALGTVRVPDLVTGITAVGENGHFIRKPERGGFQLPVGNYRVTDWECTRKDDQGATWTLSGYDYNPSSEFTVTTDQAVVVGVGEPVYAALQMTETRSELAFSLRLLGSRGETVQIMRGGEQPRAPQLQVAGAGFKATRNFEYG